MNTPDECAKKDFATRKEAAAFLGKSVNTLWRWTLREDRNGLPFHRRPNGEIEYEWADLYRWKRSHKVTDVTPQEEDSPCPDENPRG